MIELFKDGDSMAIRTDCKDEDQFVSEFVSSLSELIENGKYEHDWDFQLGHWLPQFVEVCCAYRGYKTTVDRTVVLAVGSRLLNSKDLVYKTPPPATGSFRDIQKLVDRMEEALPIMMSQWAKDGGVDIGGPDSDRIKELVEQAGIQVTPESRKLAWSTLCKAAKDFGLSETAEGLVQMS